MDSPRNCFGAVVQSVTGRVEQRPGPGSNLLEILEGQILPDQADITSGGQQLLPGSPDRSLATRIAPDTQVATLVPGLSVTQNNISDRRAIRRLWGLDRQAASESETAPCVTGSG